MKSRVQHSDSGETQEIYRHPLLRHAGPSKDFESIPRGWLAVLGVLSVLVVLVSVFLIGIGGWYAFDTRYAEFGDTRRMGVCLIACGVVSLLVSIGLAWKRHWSRPFAYFYLVALPIVFGAFAMVIGVLLGLIVGILLVAALQETEHCFR